MKNDPAPVLASIRAADRPPRLAPILRTLGYHTCCERIPRARWSTYGLKTSDIAGTLHVVGHRDGAVAYCLTLSRNPDATTAERAARHLQSADLASHALVFVADRSFRNFTLLSTGPDGVTRTCTITRTHPRASDAETLLDMVAPDHEGTASITIRYARALDRARVTGRFFDDFRDRRAAISAAWTGIPPRNRKERDQLALLFLCRLMFLYFLQHAGHLANNPRFLPELVRRRAPSPASVYRSAIVPLFFGALNRRPERRTARALSLGNLPYLNGGLFDRHALERRHPGLDLPDTVLHEAFDLLLERYRFTTREPSDSPIDATFDGAIDPEMLGRVFEGVMDADRRSTTGAFYTPAHAVDHLVRDALAAWLAPTLGSERATGVVLCREPAGPAYHAAATALASARVLDPACGSGAFLLGALSRVAAIRAAASPCDTLAQVRRDVIASTLHGVDLDADAALLCALRLWLALADTDGTVRPLPNLDRRIRQGDALLDPIDLAIADSSSDRPVAADASVRAATRTLQPLALQYLDAEPHLRDRLRSRVSSHERAIARAWIDALRQRSRHHLAELRARAADRDLFGHATDSARAASAALLPAKRHDLELASLRNRLRDDRSTPFFSFHVHFADATGDGFDLVLSNPPWVRAHRWPRAVRAATRRRYLAHTRGWQFGARLAGAPAAASAQADLALLFLERALALLAPRGVLGLLLPAKLIRSLYAGTARARLVSDTPVLSIRDCGLDQHAIFRADAFAAAIVARRADAATPAPAHVHVRLARRGRDDLAFDIERTDLPLFPDDPASPWLLAPAAARDALRRMQKAGPPLGLHDQLRVRRGIFTGANDILIISHATPRLGGLASIRALGFESADTTAATTFEDIVEASALRPLLRGADVRAWSWKSEQLVVYLHDPLGRPTQPPPRLARYLERHAAALDRRSGTRRGSPRGAIFRASADIHAPKVAWHDLAATLQAVALPASTRSALGEHGPLVPLNTTYFIPTRDDDHALVLAALLNSAPLRTFARTIAERAKDARFRFFAWTVAALPLPTRWRDHAHRLLPIARQAHADKGLDPADAERLDEIVIRAYGLDHQQLDHIREFDLWLGGKP